MLLPSAPRTMLLCVVALFTAACTTIPASTNIVTIPDGSSRGALKSAAASDLQKFAQGSDLSRAMESMGWLSVSSRGGASSVFVDGIFVGGQEVMQSIPVADVQRVELLNSAEATQRYGTGQRPRTGMVFVVTTRLGTR